MNRNFHDNMLAVLPINGEKLSEEMLQGYLDGQVEMHFSTTKDRVLGDIESIQMIAGAIDIDCSWVRHQKGRQRKWRINEKIDTNLSVFLKHGYRKLFDGGIEILGENGSMILRPAGHAENINVE